MIDPGNIPGDTASLQFGEKTQMERERHALASAGSPGQGQPPPGGQPPMPGGQPTPGAGPPVQAPPDHQPLTPDDLRPGGPVFSEPKMEPARPWRQSLREWESHPDGGPFLAQLRQRAEKYQEQQPPRKPPGQ